MVVNPDLPHLPSELALRSEAYKSTKNRLADSMARKEVSDSSPNSQLTGGIFGKGALYRESWLRELRERYEHTIEPRFNEIERTREYLVHGQLHDLIVATEGLKRAVHAILGGRVIMPTRPQNTAPHYVELLSVSGRGGKSLEFDDGSSITLTITGER